MSFFFRALIFLLLSSIILLAMFHFNLFDLSYILVALNSGKKWLALTFLMQATLSLCLLMRYWEILKAFQINCRFSRASAATFISIALGQWAPSSLAIMEIFRLGLMFGAEDESNIEVDSAAVKTQKSRIFIVSFFDRVIGFGVVLFLGACISVPIYFFGMGIQLAPERRSFLGLLCLFSVVGAFLVAVLPFVAKSRFVARLIYSYYLHLKKLANHNRLGRLSKIFSSLIFKCNNVRKVIARNSLNRRIFIHSTFWSLGVSLSSCAAIYFSAMAIGQPISFFTILAVIPIIAIASSLPIGLAGMGGQQLVAVAVFEIFSLSPKTVSAASFLQNSTYIINNMLLGVFSAVIWLNQLKAVLAKRVKKSGSL